MDREGVGRKSTTFKKPPPANFLNELKPGLEKLSRPSSKFNNQGHGGGGWNATEAHLEQTGGGEEGHEAPMQLFSQITFAEVTERERIDQKMGFFRLVEGEPKLGWLVNLHDTLIDDGSCPEGHSAVDLYFLQDDGSSFKATILYEPYFYVACKPGTEAEVEEYLKRKFSKNLSNLSIVEKEDLKLANHLVGKKCNVLKLVFYNNDQFKAVKRAINEALMKREKSETQTSTTLDSMFEMDLSKASKVTFSKAKSSNEAIDCILELLEHDISFYSRVMIDKDIRVGLWYNVRPVQGKIILEPRQDITLRPDPVILAFDIETSKLPLRFPDAAFDSIIMISYMVDGQGYLITNREIVAHDIDDFEYNPKPEYQGEFVIFNEENEFQLLKRFFDHIQSVKPTVFVTYNGDFFDWPFIDKRAAACGLNMAEEIGLSPNQSGEYTSSYASHMDCFMWVKRDSYLPQGSQNLKAVAKYKLGYDPVELDPEEMTRMAVEHPQILAQYSVSDAVATYYLYMKYVHPFTFSLCNIIPMHPDDVLRRGSGTLCEHLLMVQAHKANVIMPNKYTGKGRNFFDGHMLNSETYVGGHVEALEAGVFRSDLPIKFQLSADAFQQLIDEIDQALKFSIVSEGKLSLDDIANYDDVRADIVKDLEALRDTPNRDERPSIYHLDVGAMYPNIILTNRLQPDAIVDESTCASCEFNEGPDSTCQRKMPWSWRGEYFMANKSEYNMLRNQLEQEKFPPRRPGDPERAFHDLPAAEQEAQVKKRMGEFSQKVYSKKFTTKVVEKESIVCQRENPFYVNTVRDFRDRRYEYKSLLKQWKKKLEKANSDQDATAIYEASKMTVIYDSLQTAHKCILNSFYGYVMRKAARWYSMEMAGVVCLTGAKIIQLARQRVEKIGRPLELDTDGIWCVLPASFPENFSFQLKSGKSYSISYPCVMLNHLVHDQFTNHQYQELVNPETLEYSTRSENSIFFEVDGPYKAMILPSSLEEGRLLKKRYAVFNEDGTIAELKGFELKRRGELKLLKNFQSSIFKVFLEGTTLSECYQAVANSANTWLDIIYSKGAQLTDAEIFDFFTENRNMSKDLSSYGAQKSTAITCAKRLRELLGEQMGQDRGLNCSFIITKKPLGAPVNERATPVAIFQSEDSVKVHFLRKWLKDGSLQGEDIRELIDWDYYLERFSGNLQKLITIPAALQDIPNPIPRLPHPAWVARLSSKDKNKQRMISDMFSRAPIKNATDEVANDDDIEDAVPKPQAKAAASDSKPKIVRLPNGKRKLRTLEELKELKTGKSKKPAKKQQKKSAPLKNPINILVDYPAWLKAQKPIWLDLQKVHRQMQDGPKQGIGSFFKKSSTLITNKTWELLQISETDSLGIFRVWAIIDERLESIDIEVPRVFYVNSRVAAADFDGNEVEVTKRTRILPRNHQCLNLYELKMSEYYYRSKASMFSSMFNHKDIEGVYETQVPLLFRALIQLGGFGASKISPQQFDKSRPIKLEDIERASRPGHLYLQNGSFSPVFVFHASTSSRQFIGVFNPLNQSLTVIFVDAGRNATAIPPVRKVYSEVKEAMRDSLNESFFIFPERLEIKSEVVATEKEAFVLLNRSLLGLKAGNAGRPIVLFVQSSKSLRYYRNSGVAAFREFPSTLIASHKSDSMFPAIGWQKYALEKMLEQVFHLPSFLEQRIGLARYGNVPICNIESDFTLFLSDLFIARRLKKVENVLWCSPSSNPDLGGSENDDHSHSDLKCPELNVPCTSDNVCIELSIWDLPLNTILRSIEYSGEFDQSTSNTTSKGSIHLVDSHFAAAGKNEAVVHLANSDQESSHYAFVALRAFIKDLTAELRNKNVFAVHLLEHFHRWLTSTSSYFYDRMIVLQIHNMMKRALASIIDELRRLGSNIIYASFEKIVLFTSKTSLQAGSGYIAYVTAAISRNPSFEHVELVPSVFWDYLVWYDPYNYGGLVYQNASGGTDFSSVSDMERAVNLHWHISEFLPPPVQQTFLSVIAEYLDAVRQLKVAQIDDLNLEISAYLDSDLKRQLLKIVKDMHHYRLAEEFKDVENPFAFPKLPGSCRVMTNPALEFVKMLVMVFLLNKNLEKEVRSLKKDLLRLIDVREFSNDAEFANPCEKYILPQVICQYCNFGCDLDLTRKDDGRTVEESGADAFLVCEKCFALYDRDDIEQRLMIDLESLLSRWQLQDVRCKVCRLVKAEDLRDKCAKCTGVLETVLDQTQFTKQVRVLSNLADYFRMPTLQEASQFAKQGIQI